MMDTIPLSMPILMDGATGTELRRLGMPDGVCTEQWVLWIFVDAVTIVMWGVHFLQGGESIATLAMWTVYLINAILMYRRWNREAMCHAV